MKIFQIIQKNHAILGICPNQTQASYKKIKVTFFLYILGFTLSVTFLCHDANTILEYASNVYTTTTLAMIIVIYAIAVFKMSELFEFISECQKLIDEKSDIFQLRPIYDRTNQQVEKWSKIGYFAISRVTPICCVFPKAAVSYFTYFSTNIGNQAFELPFLIWFPFNWKNPIGYLVVITMEYVIATAVFLFGSGVIFVGVGSFLFALAGTKDLKIVLKSINERGVSARNLSWTLSQISEFIPVQSALKQLITDMLEIYQSKFMVLCAWSLGTICGVMLMIQIQIHKFISLEVLLLTIFFACYAFGVVLILCELGQRLTDAFAGINDEINKFDWYLFPPQIQRLLPMIMIASQQPVELECFGSIAGTRDTFKKVVNHGISYFMVMRQFM